MGKPGKPAVRTKRLAALLVAACLPGVAVAQTNVPSDRALDQFVPEVLIDPAPAARTSPRSLVEFESLALQQHPAIERAWAGVRAAEGQALQARLYPNPVVGFGVPQFAGDESQYNVTLSQEIVTGGKLRLSAASEWQNVERARFEVERIRFQVLTDVRRQFYSALAAQHRIDVLRQLVETSRHSRDLGEAQLRAGEATRTDLLLLEVELNKAEVALMTATTALETRLAQLAAAVGDPSLLVDRLEGDFHAPLPEITIDEARDQVVASNARLQMAEAQIRRSQFRLQREIAEPVPTVDIMGGYQYQAQPIHDQATMQLNVSVPLWNRNQGGIRAARAGVQQARAERDEVRIELSNEVAEAYRRFKSAEQLVERYQSAILPRSRESFDLAQRLYEQGEIDFLRLLQAQRVLIEANLDFIDAQENRWIAGAEIAGLLQLEAFP